MSILPQVSRVKREANNALKILLYAPPGFGKSYWANRFPDPLFINTDGNLQYLDAPGVVVKYWYSHPGTNKPEVVAESFVNIVEELVMKNGGGFKTIVVDLIDGVVNLCRQAKLKEFNIQDESDVPYGKVYKMIRESVLNEINKLRALPVNVILLSHEKEITIKDRVGRESIFYTPNIDDKLLKPLSGTGFTLRGYWKDVTNDRTGESTAIRMLSLTPKGDEFHVTRFTDSEGTPVALEDVELTYENVQGIFDRLKDPELAGSFKTVEADSLTATTARDKVASAKQIKARPTNDTPAPSKKELPPKPVKVEVMTPRAEEPKVEVVTETVVVQEVVGAVEAPTETVTAKTLPPKPNKTLPPKPSKAPAAPATSVVAPAAVAEEEEEDIPAPVSNTKITDAQSERIAKIRAEVAAKIKAQKGNK